MIQRSIKRMPHARAHRRRRARRRRRREGRAARALVQELQGRAHRSGRSDFGRGRHLGRSPPTPRSTSMLIDWSPRRRPRARTGARALLAVRALAQRQDPDLPDGRARRGLAIPVDVMEMVDEFIWTLEDTAAFVGGRVVACDPPLPRGDAAAARRGADELHARSTSTRGTRRATPAARRSSSRRSAASSSTTSARTCCAPTCRSASASLGSLLDHTRARWASTRSTRRACSARTARTA